MYTKGYDLNLYSPTMQHELTKPGSFYMGPYTSILSYEPDRLPIQNQRECTIVTCRMTGGLWVTTMQKDFKPAFAFDSKEHK